MLRESVGDDGREAYTAIVWGGLLSLEKQKFAEAETVSEVEGNMCGTAMRGAEDPVRGALSNERPYRDVRQAWRVVRKHRLVGVVSDR